MKQWTDEQFNAYLAGFTDGEGCIRLEDGKFVNICISNCVRHVLDAIQARLGYGQMHSQQQKPHWRERFVLKVRNARDCRDYLKRVRPFLVIKASIADKALLRIGEMEAKWDRLNRRNATLRLLVASGVAKSRAARQLGISPQRMAAVLRGEVRTGL